jgi:two-component system chemotaxis response regulator CheB
MLRRDVVVAGASAGGIEAFCSFLAGLPVDLPAAVLVVVHMPPEGPSVLPQVLGRCGPLPTGWAIDGEPLKPGRVYVAARDHHLLVHDGVVRLSRSARQNRVRPAVDALFRSAARWCGSRTIAVVLSGALDDGAAGLAAVHARGGAAVVQDPEDAVFGGMPRAALAAVNGDAATGTAPELARCVTELAGTPVSAPSTPPHRDLLLETDMAEHDHPLGQETPGEPVGLGCPECNGGMSVIEQGSAVYYRCHVGHSYAPQTLIAAQREKVESALWAGVSYLEEQAAVHRHLAARTPANDGPSTGESQHAAADLALRTADTIRQSIHSESGK